MEIYTTDISQTPQAFVDGQDRRLFRLAPPAGAAVRFRRLSLQLDGTLQDTSVPPLEVYLAHDNVGSSITFTGSLTGEMKHDLSAPASPSIVSITEFSPGDPPDGDRMWSGFIPAQSVRVETVWPEGRGPIFDSSTPVSLLVVGEDAYNGQGFYLSGFVEWSYQSG